MDTPPSTPVIVNPEPPKKPKAGGILGINLLIFLCYFIVGFGLGSLLPGKGFEGIIVYGYMIHAGILFIMALSRSVSDKKPGYANAWDFLLSFLAILIIGFSACTFAYTQLYHW